MSDIRDLRTLPEPFATADLPDEVVNQRVTISISVGNHASRHGRQGMAVWLDGEPTSGEVGGSVGAFPPSSYRGQSNGGFRLSEDERRYVAACLYGAALNLIEHRNETEGEPA